MKLHTTLTALLAGGALASTASAQVITEIRISTSGADEEYVEILGTPGQSTDGLMLVVVEGDDFSDLGFLDRVYDLSGTRSPRATSTSSTARSRPTRPSPGRST